MYEPKFDIDLEFGEEGERLIESVIKSGKIECKRDRLTGKTGNLAIEYMYRGKPSGISTTEADWWAFLIEGSILMVETERLKDIAREYLKDGHVVDGGDDMASKIILVPVTEFLRG